MPIPDDQPLVLVNGSQLDSICEDVFVDPAATTAERDRLRVAYVGAVRRIELFYGTLYALRPITIFCKTDACRAYFGRDQPNRSVSWTPNGHVPWAARDNAPRRMVEIAHIGRSSELDLAHELVHIEFSYRVGPADVPAWFAEGVATVAADVATDICTATGAADPVDLDALADDEMWISYTAGVSHGQAAYCAAKAEVDAWLRHQGNGGLLAQQAALTELFRELRAGTPFAEAYGPLLTQ